MRYRDTLNLPKTDFPMRGQLPKREPEILAGWEEIDLYGRLRSERAGRKRYVLHDGPPYSNNHIHMGTAANKIWKDVVIKYRSLLGEDAPYVPGWDNHGMPIENEVSKQFQAEGVVPDRIALRHRCREYAHHWLGVQRTEFRRLGVLGAWSNPYLTMDAEFEATLVEVFAELAEKGFIFRGLRSIHWCPTCQSALAEAEIEYHDVPSPSIYVAFPHRAGERRAEGPQGEAVGELDRFAGLSALIWTTTPWTLPANLFIMVGPEYDYVVVEAAGRPYLLAAERLAAVQQAVGWSEVRELARFKGADLEGATFTNPLGGSSALVDGTPYVSLEEGTGLVHSAPGHGKEDFEVGQRAGFPVLSPVDAAGNFTDEAGPWAGENAVASNPRITGWLTEMGRLLAETEIQHSYPHCWRCTGGLIFRATNQWFMGIDHADHRQKSLAAVQDVSWDPPGSRNRIRDAVANRPDWCLSRQRSWGVGIPAIFCQGCGTGLLDQAVMANVAARCRERGSDDWFETPVEAFLPEDFTCSECGKSGPFRKETDILDVWFDSGATHRAVCEVRPDQHWPADLYLEGPDQHRGWFNSSLMVAVATRGAAPYRAVQTHGWTLDAEGRAMHKSAGNAVSPLEVIDNQGADIVRLWACSSDWRTDVRVGQEILTRVSDAYRKVRNTFRFLLANLSDYPIEGTAATRRAEAQGDPVNAAFLARLEDAFREVHADYAASRNHGVVSRLVDLCTTDLSAIYLDVRKDALYTLRPDDPLRRSTQAVLAYALEQLVHAWCPILSFTADEVWSHSEWLKGRADSVFLSEWPVPAAAGPGEKPLAWQDLLSVRDAVNQVLEPKRAAKEFASFAEASVQLAADGEVKKLLESLEAESWRSLLLVSSVEVSGLAAEGGEAPALQPLGAGRGRLVVTAAPTAEKRCERCWVHRPSVGASGEHPEICERCLQALPQGFVLTSD